MPGPQAAQILQMSHPVTEESAKCPVIARGGKGTGRSSVELTGALCMYAAVDVDAIDVEVPYDMNFFVSQVCRFNALFNSRPFVSDTSLKRIDREGLGKRRKGTRQQHI